MIENTLGVHCEYIQKWLARDIELEWPDEVPLTSDDDPPLALIARKDADGYINEVPDDNPTKGDFRLRPTFVDLIDRTDSGKRKYKLQSLIITRH